MGGEERREEEREASGLPRERLRGSRGERLS
jgi:hypothetical protein